jgi:lysophospholipase L1-like esterase
VALRYVALGDSYTIGTALPRAEERWPNQLVARLSVDGPGLELVANLGVNGFTSADVIVTELPRLGALRPDFATLLIGVNDVVQGVPEATYADNGAQILDALLAALSPDRIVAVATPDFTVTAQGAAYGEIMRELAAGRAIAFVDIHDLSLRAAGDSSLVAVDGLHPSRAQYALWVDRIAPVVAELLDRSQRSGSASLAIRE